MSNLNPKILQSFLENPDSLLNGNFSMWETESFINTSGIVEHLISSDPQSPLIPKLTLKMLNYMKYCYDNDKSFPWEETFPATPQKNSREQFADYYNSQMSGVRIS